MRRFALLGLMVLLCCSSAAHADPSWRCDATNKQDAARQARSTGFGFDTNGNERQDQLRAMWADWVQAHPGLASVNDQQAFANFKQNMRQVQSVNQDDSISWFASGNEFSHLNAQQFVALYAKTLAPGVAHGRRMDLELSIIASGTSGTSAPGNRKLLQHANKGVGPADNASDNVQGRSKGAVDSNHGNGKGKGKHRKNCHSCNYSCSSSAKELLYCSSLLLS